VAPYLVKHEALGLKVASLAGVGVFLVVALGISYIEFRYRRLNDVGEVTRGLRLPVVGTIPIVQRAIGRKSSAGIQQVLIESVDMARTLLLHQFRQKNLRIVMITSAGSGEGKTLLSAHLAGSLARAGSRVLLIDGDLRRPSLHKVFGLESGAGLGDALRGEVQLSAVIRPGPMEGLWVVPAGTADVMSLRALVHGTLNKLLEAVKQDFDFIIIDSAPVLPVADSQLIAQAVDGVILSVLQDVSRLPSVYAAYERLMMFQANVLGVIMHGGPSTHQGSDYPYLPLPTVAARVAATVPATDTESDPTEPKTE
jgi:capsular exopolysaccharide synthesis family protein